MKDYINETKRLIADNKELFSGQNQEILEMAMTEGCDINEHVPTLIRYGKQVDHITEMGVRFGWSTRSFLFARPKKLISIDKFEWNSIHPTGAVYEPGNSQYHKYKKLYKGKVDFIYIFGDSTKMELPEETDLLFIDTFHHKKCLEIELAKHANKVKRFILLHDTTTFGERGQADSSGLFFNKPTTDEVGSGLQYAIHSFLINNLKWTTKEIYINNNGLTVLEKK